VPNSSAGHKDAAPATTKAGRHVFCLGDSDFGGNGWRYDGTANGWIRQYPSGLPQRVSFDNSVNVMRSVGCDTIKAELQPNDPDTNGGTTVQRAQLYVDDAQLAKYGRQPALGDTRGETTWYGFAFATNAGYTPQTGKADGTGANWNLIFSWHNTPVRGVWGPQANIQLVVATTAPSNGATAVSCGGQYTTLSQPRLSIELTGGNQDDSRWFVDDSDSTCRRYFGPVFQPGHVYRVAMAVKWGDHKSGALKVWIDGTEVTNVSGIDNLWYGAAGQAGLYPVFENYRPYSFAIRSINDVYYGGLIKGTSLDDVQVP
jgi:hypothetical protein